MKKLTVNQKIQFYILTSAAIIFATAIGYISFKSKNQIMAVTTELADAYSREYANLTGDKLNYYINSTRTLRQIFEDYEVLEENNRREVLSSYLKKVLQDNETFLSVWSIMEPHSIDNRDENFINTIGSTILGNFRYVYYREGAEIKLSEYIEQDPGEVLSGKIYNLAKNRKKETITDPYYYSYTGNKADEILETNMVQPILKNGEFIGAIALDVPLTTIKEVIDKYQPIEGSFAFLLSHTGMIVSFPDETIFGKSISLAEFEGKDTVDVVKKIKQKSAFSFNANYNATDYYFSLTPVTLGNTGTPWFVGLALPKNTVESTAKETLNISIIVGLIGLLLVGLITWFQTNSITRPIKKLTFAINNIAHGNVDKSLYLDIKSSDEIGEMGTALNKYIDGYIEKAEFAEQIGEGNLNASFNLLSNDDQLGKSLLKMQNSLQSAKEEEDKRRIEDQTHRWTNEGIAKFAEILRQDNNNIKKLSFNIMSNLVNYVEGNQGALFVRKEDEDRGLSFELKSAIAYNKERYLRNEIKVGEDLVGRCAHEKKTIYISDIPQNYIEITSGMGTASPKYLLIVPAILNTTVYGIIEIASFNEFKEFQIKFIERLGESIASTLASVRTAEKTQQLLNDSRHQQEELSAQEEEMRQNLEELQTTQEEAARREFEMRGLINALGSSTYTVEYDLNGYIIDVNQAFSQLIGLPREQIIGLNHRDGIDFSRKSKEEYDQFWEDLRHGNQRSEINKIEYNDKTLYMSETYSPILDQEEKPYKILKIGFDITELKETQIALKEKTKEVIKLRNEKPDNSEEIEELKKQLEEAEQANSKIEAELNSVLEENLKLQKETTEQQPVKQETDIPLPPAGNPLVDFSEEMVTSIQELDDQHKRIIELVNEIYIGLRTDKAKKEIKENLKMLVDFASWHFSNEERYFEEFSFELKDKHTSNHKAFANRIETFRKKYQSGRIKFYDDEMRFIKQWIETHFTIDDKEYVNLFRENGL